MGRGYHHSKGNGINTIKGKSKIAVPSASMELVPKQPRRIPKDLFCTLLLNFYRSRHTPTSYLCLCHAAVQKTHNIFTFIEQNGHRRNPKRKHRRHQRHYKHNQRRSRCILSPLCRCTRLLHASWLCHALRRIYPCEECQKYHV